MQTYKTGNFMNVNSISIAPDQENFLTANEKHISLTNLIKGDNLDTYSLINLENNYE